MPPAPRTLVPEVLDSLPAADPRARASRRDLSRLNALMFQPAILARALLSHAPAPPARLLDLGAGDGAFTLALARRLARRWPGVSVTLLDRHDLLDEARRAAFAALGWHAEAIAADVFEWLGANPQERFDAVTANLFLHHFEDRPLARLLAAAAKLAPVFAAAEPRRGLLPLAASRLVFALGANAVTRHDAPASVRAGFRARELSALWPEPRAWAIEERPAGLFTHLFAAHKMSP